MAPRPKRPCPLRESPCTSGAPPSTRPSACIEATQASSGTGKHQWKMKDQNRKAILIPVKSSKPICTLTFHFPLSTFHLSQRKRAAQAAQRICTCPCCITRECIRISPTAKSYSSSTPEKPGPGSSTVIPADPFQKTPSA